MACRWGYSSANYTLQVVKNYTAADIPIDVIWNDIDWMRDYVAFTYNDEYGSRGYTHKDVQALNDYLAAHHQHHVQIVDPNIPAVLTEKDGTSYTPYVQGKARNIFVRHPANDTILVRHHTHTRTSSSTWCTSTLVSSSRSSPLPAVSCVCVCVCVSVVWQAVASDDGCVA